MPPKNINLCISDTGYYYEPSSNPEIILSDGKREILASEFDLLKESSMQVETKRCSVLGKDNGKVKWMECSNTHHFLCEYKGNKMVLKCCILINHLHTNT